MNEKYDLEDKINLIYDYMYNENTKNCFTFDKLVLGKIGLEDIKIPIPSADIKDETYEKNKTDIFNARFKLIQFDEDNLQLLFKRYSDQFPVNIKITFYKHSKNSIIDSFDSNINNDSLFSYLLSYLVLSNMTRHILLPVINLDAKISDLEQLIKGEICYNKIKDKILNNIITDTCCLQLREHFFKTTDLQNFLTSNRCSFKPLLFQVIHTLATIQKEFPGFRHNNLKLSNIMIYMRKDSNIPVEYNGFRNDHFYLSNFEVDIKITNFEYSVIPKYYGLINQKNNMIEFADMDNSYYDLYTFLNDLIHYTSKIKCCEQSSEQRSTQSSKFESECNMETKKFLDKIIPPHIRGEKKLTKNMVIAMPVDLLYDTYFDEYRNKPSKNVDKNINLTNHMYLTGKSIDTYLDSDNYSILGNQNKIISKSTIMKSQKHNRIIKTITKDTKIHRSMTETEEDANTRFIRNELKQQVGGDEKPTMAPYKAERNNPFMTNDQRETNKKFSAENPPREPPVLLEQKVYDTSKPVQSKPQFPPSFIPLYDQQGDVMNHMLPYSRVINQPPVQKVYNVSLSNPIGNYTSLNRIYEDVLPGTPFAYTAITLFERSQLVDYLRNSMIENNDGEEMTITGGKNSLLSYIKVMDINPYITKKNPYENLPRNFLLYRAGYPVRFDEKNKQINMGKPSMGINIRVYMMSQGDLRCMTINKHIGSDNFDLWREMKYYDWVRNDIIKKKVSPNFICPILYKIDSGSKIDWSKVEMIKYRSYTNDTMKELKENQEKINYKHNITKDSMLSYMLPRNFRKQIEIAVKEEMGIDPNSKEPSKCERPTPHEMQRMLAIQKDAKDNILSNDKKEDLTLNSGKVLILLTEAPTTSIIQWSSALYESFGSQKKMVTSGYHTPSIWRSILFQLVYTFSVLQEKGIVMKNLSLENNIYIKDIFSDTNAIGSWIYKIDNVEYYVPNYGYILVFDSKYADIPVSHKLLKVEPSAKEMKEQIFKINGTIYDKNDNTYGANASSVIYNQFKELIDPDNFGHNFKVAGGTIPDDSIIALLKQMYDNIDSTQKIRNIISKFFLDYVHNRVGTILTQSEKANINVLSKPNFNKGNLMILQKRYQEYEWVVYLDEDNTNSIKKRNVITCDSNNNYLVESVFSNVLYSYPEGEKVLPETKKNMKYDENHIYETYNLDDLTK